MDIARAHRLVPLRRFVVRLQRAVLEAVHGAAHGFESSEPEEYPQVRFHARLTADTLDGGWTAECIELPGCVSDGETQDEALRNLTDAIAEVIAVRLGSHLPEIGRDDERRARELALTV